MLKDLLNKSNQQRIIINQSSQIRRGIRRNQKVYIDQSYKNVTIKREMILCKHYERENEQQKRYNKQIEANNDILIKSNLNLNQKWEKIQKSFIYYKTFFVEHKDQLTQLLKLVQSEKEKVQSQEVYNELGFNSVRVSHIRKGQTSRKKILLHQTITSYVCMYQGNYINHLQLKLKINQEQLINQQSIKKAIQLIQVVLLNDGEIPIIYLDKKESFIENTEWRINLKKYGLFQLLKFIRQNLKIQYNKQSNHNQYKNCKLLNYELYYQLESTTILLIVFLRELIY